MNHIFKLCSIAVLFVFGFIACGPDDKPNPPDNEPPISINHLDRLGLGEQRAAIEEALGEPCEVSDNWTHTFRTVLYCLRKDTSRYVVDNTLCTAFSVAPCDYWLGYNFHTDPKETAKYGTGAVGIMMGVRQQ